MMVILRERNRYFGTFLRFLLMQEEGFIIYFFYTGYNYSLLKISQGS